MQDRPSEPLTVCFEFNQAEPAHLIRPSGIRLSAGPSFSVLQLSLTASLISSYPHHTPTCSVIYDEDRPSTCLSHDSASVEGQRQGNQPSSPLTTNPSVGPLSEKTRSKVKSKSSSGSYTTVTGRKNDTTNSNDSRNRSDNLTSDSGLSSNKRPRTVDRNS